MTLAQLESSLRYHIVRNLDDYMYSNAIFLSERLVAENASEDSLNLLGSSYFRAGFYMRAYSVLKVLY